MKRLLAVVGLTVTVAGCATPSRAPQVATAGTGPVAAATPRPGPAAGQVIGSNAALLVGLFGQPALDIREGTARKLQFSGAACVLDAYLYPRDGGGEPVTTYVDARRPDGRTTDPAACAEALRQR